MIQGLLLLNKPEGITSFSAVAKIKRLAGEKRVGHTGTLDPMATGVLPVLIGRATALSSYLLDADKRYTATILFGTVTDTGDITGQVTDRRQVNITENQIDEAIKRFTGEITQVPPMYSAIKKDGVPLYKLARQGKTVEVAARRVTIYSINKLSGLNNNTITIDVCCSKGTYIRSLCQDIGEYLGCGATLSKLHRTATSGFTIDQCISLEDLTEENISSHILPTEKAVENFRYITVSEKQAFRFSNGGALGLERLKFIPSEDGEIIKVKYKDRFLGLGIVDLQNRHIAIKCVIDAVSRPKTALALGTFDGVHSGHRAVIKNAVSSGLKPVAVTFEVPPKTHFGKDVGLLMLKQEKTEAIKGLGITDTLYLDFEEFRDYSPEQFLNFLKQRLNCAFISCGFNYRFGKDGAGDTAFLQKFCQDNDITLSVCQPVYEDGQIVSSTYLRALLQEGKVDKVGSICCREFGFSGEIIHGDARGRTIGFPTINQMYPNALARLKFGVYKTKVTLSGREYTGITNVGIRPTFENDFVSAETYVLDFTGDVYGEIADIRFIEFIRSERKFASLKELTDAIDKDIKSIKKEQ